MNQSTTKFIGLDVSKNTIAIAIANEGREKPSFISTIPNTPEAIRKWMKKYHPTHSIEVCYEAGPTGYGIHRLLTSMGIDCIVVAPSLIPKKAGDRVKTDRKDAIELARLLRSGELTSIYVPTKEDEALRDLVRAREDAREDCLRAKQRIAMFLLRHDIHAPKGINKWTLAYRNWLSKLNFAYPTQEMAFEEYLHQLFEIEQRIERFEQEIQAQADEGYHAPMIQAFQTLRGIAAITATALVAEIGSFQRFKTPKQFMAYIGLVPSEYSSGESTKKGRITKTGNRHVRRLLIEAAWSYRYLPAVKGRLKKRQEGQPSPINAISWKAQHRLHKRYFTLLSKGKNSPKVITAIARELAGFIWAIAQVVENPHIHTHEQDH